MSPEVPPTAGMPLCWSDVTAGRGASTLESRLASYLDVPDVQIECSGTASFMVALQALKSLSPRRTVVIPGYTCPLVPIAIHRAGLNIRVCDTAVNSCDFDMDELKRLCDEDALCVVATHIGGMPSDLDSICEIARSSGAYVVEDAAQSLGAQWKGRKVGTIGDIGFYSFAVGKGLPMYEGGALVARDPEMRAALKKASREIVGTDRLRELKRTIWLIGYTVLYSPAAMPYMYGHDLRRLISQGRAEEAVGDIFSLNPPLHRVSEYRKSMAASAFERFDGWLKANRNRGRSRAAKLAQLAGITVLQEPPGTEGSWPFLMVLFPDSASCSESLSALWTAGIGVTKLFIHEITGYDYLKEVLPPQPLQNSKSFADRCITISNHESLSDEQFEQILERLSGSRLLQTN